MMRNVIQEGNPPVPVWIDLSNPTAEELLNLGETYGLHATSVQDCLEPAHLPKHEKLGDTTFLIIRAYDEECRPDSDTIQSMTRKLAFFLGDRFLISIHRQDPSFLREIREKYERTKTDGVYLQVILLEVLMAAVETYHRPLENIEHRIQHFETSILTEDAALTAWTDVFRTKCRLMVIKRMLWHSMNTVQKYIPYSNANLPLYQDLKERIESLLFFADSLLDDLNNLLNIQLSLASNRTNEVVRVLTVFSVFFLPINFIVGVYGMNFRHMPELEWKHGYIFVWGLILSTIGSIYLWFRKRGLMR